MLQPSNTITLPRCAGNGGSSGRISDQFGLLTRLLVTKVAQELQEAHVVREGDLAEVPKHPRGRFEEGKEALGAMLVHLPTGVCLLRMIDVRVEVPLQRPRAAGRIGLQAILTCTARSAACCTVCSVQSVVAWMTTVPCRLTQAMRAGRSLSSWRRPGSRCLRRPRGRCPRGFVPPCWAWPFCPAV